MGKEIKMKLKIKEVYRQQAINFRGGGTWD